MPPPASAARHALAAASLLACAALAGCTAADARCPGEAVAALALTGVRELAPDPEVATCGAAVGYDDRSIALAGTLSDATGSDGAAFCPDREHAATLFGARDALTYDVSVELPGAVLGGCGPACAATLAVTLRGTLVPGTGAEPGAFTGTYEERLEAASGACGACALPCVARYQVSGEAAPR